MHISEGILSGPVLVAGAVFSITGLAVSLRRLNPADIPKTALLCAVFFAASLVRVPLGPSSVHLVLCGLMGALLGWSAVISIFVALLLQALLFQFGGLTTLGVNTFNMSAPAVFFGLLLGRTLTARSARVAVMGAFGIGFLSLLAAASLAALSLYLSGEHFMSIALTMLASYLPLACIEGLVTVACVQFLRKVKPGFLPGAAGGSPDSYGPRPSVPGSPPKKG